MGPNHFVGPASNCSVSLIVYNFITVSTVNNDYSKYRGDDKAIGAPK